MKKFVLAAVAATTLFGASAQAAPVGVVRGLVGTGVAVLQAPGTTIATVITGRSVYTGNLAPLGLNFANAIVPILVGPAGMPASAIGRAVARGARHERPRIGPAPAPQAAATAASRRAEELLRDTVTEGSDA